MRKSAKRRSPAAGSRRGGARSRTALLSALCAACIGLPAAYIFLSGGTSPYAAAGLPPLASLPDLQEQPAPSTSIAADRTGEAAATSGRRVVPAGGQPAHVRPHRSGTEMSAPSAASRPAHTAAATPSAPALTGGRPLFLLRHTGIDQSYGVLAAEFGSGAGATRQATSLRCDRVHFAGGRGVCLEARRGAITTYSAVLFDARLQPTARLPLKGIPSRTRVSPDGRYAATTVFTFGHSYAASTFSTHTQIIDAATGEAVIADLEELEVWADGTRIRAEDFNFWGVTFAGDSNRFYATLRTRGATYLVAGDIAGRRASVIREGVECPSLSPDGTRVAFKKLVAGPGLSKWTIGVLDLATLREAGTAELRTIDEQVEWFDNRTILYTQPDETGRSPAVRHVWAVAADGSGEPAMLLKQAESPTIVRESPPAAN